ncbi:S8 family peptidase [Polycladomyces subterraneus]|nr:S8 family serine peptidase [Polycladomyces subterraneus]
MKKVVWVTWISLFALLITAACGQAPREHKVNEEDSSKTVSHREWVIKWKEEADPDFLKTVDILHESLDPKDNGQTMLIRLKPDVDEEKWESRWSSDPRVEYLHPNHKFKVESRVSMQYRGGNRTYYLKRIRAEAAWPLLAKWKKQGRVSNVTVAVVDTGVDLNHPMLAPFLVAGANLRDPTQPPQDHMGHGTRVASVIAAVWGSVGGKRSPLIGSAHIMPIKVMEDGQDGDVYHTAEGIREAVRRKADVIVLAQGSWTYSETMAEAVQEAEQAGVTVVGAAGNASLNDSGDILYDHPLYYPAAFSTVLGVGSVDAEGQRVMTSNMGSGLDVMAPGENIWSAMPGGKYGYDSGTSFAAPQVAGLASLVKERFPFFTPAQIRNLIRQTARPSDEERWNIQYGFGTIDVYRAMTAKPQPDIFEPNDSASQAMPMSTDQVYQATLHSSSDTDWYRIHLFHPGTLMLTCDAKRHAHMRIRVEVERTGQTGEYDLSSQPLYLTVPGGQIRVKVWATDTREPIAYTLTNAYSPQVDRNENNDYQWNATKVKLTPGLMSIEGTWHKQRDMDWYQLEIPHPGMLEVRLGVVTPRADPVLFLQEDESWHTVRVDVKSEGEEETIRLHVPKGFLYVRASDYGGNPIIEPYQLIFHYQPEMTDASEPNDRSDQATLLFPDETVTGRLTGPADLDWYVFQVTEPSRHTIRLQIPKGWEDVELILYDSGMRALKQVRLSDSRRVAEVTRMMEAGNYYIRLQTSGKRGEGAYSLVLKRPD